jgi:prepilin-type processing-associated H-X9-DG protein
MTQIPQIPPEQQLPTLSYARRSDARNGMAVAALVLGLLGFLMCPIAAVAAIVTGIIGLVRANNLRPLHRRRWAAIAGICCGTLGLLLVPTEISILFPPGRTMPRRAICSANLRGIGQGMHIYANDNEDWFPIDFHRPPPEGAGPDVTAVAFIGRMSANLTTAIVPGDTDAATHPSRSMFMLVISGVSSAMQFVCPDSGDREDDLRNSTPAGTVAAMPNVNRFDFKGYSHLSYGYQLPFGRNGRPREALDPRMPIAADKGPFFQAGTPVLAEGRTPDAFIGVPGAKLTLPGVQDDKAALKLPNAAWAPYNSRNHKGEGQNVLYVDGHVEFQRTPLAGLGHDNIYTQEVTPDSLFNSIFGRLPADFRGPLTETDAIIIP